MTSFHVPEIRVGIDGRKFPRAAELGPIRLLERCGFKREGHARAYLRINGIWQDHLLYALLESDPVPLRLPRRDKA